MTEQVEKNTTQGTLARPNRTEIKVPQSPDPDVLKIATAADRRVQSRITTVRQGFIRLPRDREPADDERPPLASLLSGSRDALRIRLYLAVLWLAGGGDKSKGHRVEFPARAFAELLGLGDPAGRGQRRVRDALKAFADEKLIALQDRPGHPKVISLLREDGSGELYDRPGIHFKQSEADDTEVDSVHRFIQLPPVFWTEGWAQVLSAPAIAMLLVMLLITQNGRQYNQWVSTSQRRFYGLSDDTWTRGVAELTEHGIVAVRRAPVSADVFGFRRMRNTYSLILERLGRRPDAVLAEDDDLPLEVS